MVPNLSSPTGTSSVMTTIPDAAIWTLHKCHGVSNHRQLNRLSNNLFRLTTKKMLNSALQAICDGKPLVTNGFQSQRNSNAGSIPCHDVTIEFHWVSEKWASLLSVQIVGCFYHRSLHKASADRKPQASTDQLSASLFRMLKDMQPNLLITR